MDSFEFPNILADVENHPEFDFFNEELQQDPIFQFVDFNQGDNQLLFQQPDILPDSGGVILPQEHSPRQSRQGGVLLIQDHSPGLLREGGEPPRQGDICGIPSQSRVLVRQDHSPALPQERGIPPRQDIRDLARHSDVLVRQEDSPGQSRQGGISRPRVEGDQTETSRQEPRSGMIMPLPSSYATVSQALSSNGGIFSSPATRASTRPQNKDVSEAQTPITFATPTHGDWRSLSRSDTDPRVVIGYQPSRLVVLARTDSGESVASSHPARRGADPQIAAFGLTSTGLPSSTEANPSGDWRSLSRSSDFAPGQITRDSTSSTSGVDRADTNGLSVSKGGDVWIARLAGAGWTPPSSPPGAAGFSMGHSVLALITALVLCAGMAHLLAPVLSLGLLSKVMMVCVGLASAHLERCAYRAVENARGGWSHLLSSFGRSLGGGSSHRRRGARTLSPLAMIA